MSEAETRSLGQAAILLLLVSTLRWGWAARPAASDPTGPDVLPELLESSRERLVEANARTRPLADGERLDPNRAAERDLDRLPGIGPATAKAIVAAREAGGPFRSLEDLGRVDGIGRATLERIEKHLEMPRLMSAPHGTPGRTAEAPQRVNVNRADEALLLTLPGVGPVLARRIMEVRSRAPFTSVEDLLRVSGIGPATLERLRGRVTTGR
jgi:competence protein ComEA